MTGHEDGAADQPEHLAVQGRPPPPVGSALAAGDPEVQRQLAVAFASAPLGMAVTTDDGLIVQANDALGRLLGYPAQALLGRLLEDLASPEVAAQISAGRAEMIRADVAEHTASVQLRRADHRPVPVSLSCARVPPPRRAPDTVTERSAYVVVHVQDLTERRASDAELTHRALHDLLTGLPNRALLLDRLDRALARLSRRPSSIAVLFADLDGFKAVNDNHGHAVGDQVLQEVARRLRALQRPGDTACRLGGDEFVVLCEDSGRAEADGVAKRLQAALAEPVPWSVLPGPRSGEAVRGSVRLTVSIGIAATTDSATSCHQLLHEADTAMYRAKRQ